MKLRSRFHSLLPPFPTLQSRSPLLLLMSPCANTMKFLLQAQTLGEVLFSLLQVLDSRESGEY